MCVPDKTITGGLGTLTPYSPGKLSPTQTYTPPIPGSQPQGPQASFTTVNTPQLGLPAGPAPFAPRIERAAATQPQYTTDANGVKRPAKTGYQSLQITRQ